MDTIGAYPGCGVDNLVTYDNDQSGITLRRQRSAALWRDAYQGGDIMSDNRIRFLAEDVYGNFLSRDLIVQEPKIVRALSGPFAVLNLKFILKSPVLQVSLLSRGYLDSCRKRNLGERVILASGIVQPGEVDPESGILH